MDRAIPYTAPYPALIGYHPGRSCCDRPISPPVGAIAGASLLMEM